MSNMKLTPQLRMALPALLAGGLLLGISTNLAKIAGAAGINPLAFLAWSLAGATLLLATVSRLRGHTTPVTRRSIEYFVVSGFLGIAGSNLIFFSAVPHLGVSFVALMISLPPLMTYVGALMLRMEAFCWWRASGVMLALAGAAWLILGRWAMPDAEPFWIVLTLVGPVLLSAGNLYRSRRWPPGASAESLAPGMLMGATAILWLAGLLPGASLALPAESGHAAVLIAVQAAVFAGQFLLLFVVQKAGGPVLLSLLGGVSAVFGVPIAMLLLGEPALPGLPASATLISAGIACMLIGATACLPLARLRSVEPLASQANPGP